MTLLSYKIVLTYHHFRVACCSVTKSCPTLWNPMDCSTPGFPVLHHLPAFSQTHVHWVCDAIQPSLPLSPPSSPALNLSQHLSPFQWLIISGGQSIGASALASFLPVHIQGWFPLGLISLNSLLSRGLSYSANSPLIQCKSPVMC